MCMSVLLICVYVYHMHAVPRVWQPNSGPVLNLWVTTSIQHWS